MVSLVSSTKYLRKKHNVNAIQTIQKTETERIHPNSLFEASITLIPKSEKMQIF